MSKTVKVADCQFFLKYTLKCTFCQFLLREKLFSTVFEMKLKIRTCLYNRTNVCWNLHEHRWVKMLSLNNIESILNIQIKICALKPISKNIPPCCLLFSLNFFCTLKLISDFFNPVNFIKLNITESLM